MPDLVALDALARQAEAEQAEANRLADIKARAAVVDSAQALPTDPSIPVDPSAFADALHSGPPLSNLYSTTVDQALVPLSPGFAISPNDGALSAATASLGSTLFTAHEPGAGGNGISLTATLDSDVSPIPPTAPIPDGGGTILLYAIRDANVSYIVEIVHGGALAATTYRVSSDGGATFSPTGPAEPAPSPLPSTPTFAFSADPTQAQVFVAGSQWLFSVRRRFTVIGERAEFIMRYGFFEEDQAPPTPDVLLGAVDSGTLDAGTAIFSGGRGGVHEAVLARLTTAAKFSGVAAATKESILQALQPLTG